jgi:hypothetical protein
MGCIFHSLRRRGKEVRIDHLASKGKRKDQKESNSAVVPLHHDHILSQSASNAMNGKNLNDSSENADYA